MRISAALPRPPESCLECPIRAFTAYLPLMDRRPELFRALEREVTTIPARRVIVRRGDVPTKVFTLFAGWAYRYTLLSDGRRQILSFILPGELISLRALRATPMTFSVQALTEVVLCAFDAAKMRATLNDPAEAEYLVDKYMEICAEADLRLTDLGRRSATQRVARLMLGLERRLVARGLTVGDAFEFPLRQEHIADALGLTAVHVSRTLSAMRESGAIVLEGGRLTIADRRGLMEILGDGEPLAQR